MEEDELQLRCRQKDDDKSGKELEELKAKLRAALRRIDTLKQEVVTKVPLR